MELLAKLERAILAKLKGVASLPAVARRWLGNNVWWVAIISLVLTSLATLINLNNVLDAVFFVGSPAATYVVAPTVNSYGVFVSIVSLITNIIMILALAFAIKPLRAKQRQGWVLLFFALLVDVAAMIILSLLSLNPLAFITSTIFALTWGVIAGYFLFEMHGEFSHSERSAGVKAAKLSKK